MPLAVVYITPELIGEFCRDGDRHVRITGGVPADAKFVNAIYDYGKKAFRAYFEGPSLPPPVDGEDFTEYHPQAEQIEDAQ